MVILVLGSAPAWAAQRSQETLDYFEAHVRPVLAERCISCHGEKVQKGGLRLDSRAAMLKGANGEAVIVPGQPDRSRLIRAIHRSGSVKMPPDAPLSTRNIEALTTWIRMGAHWPAAKSRLTTGVSKKLWALQAVRKAPVPTVRNGKWARSPIDRFILARLERQGISPSGSADRRTLLRRVTYDLTGLPPTSEEMDAFLADGSPEAYAKAVDRLLASPRYGERWGRYWLDVARYSDTKGYVYEEVRRYPFSYAYRDWVIRAFNQDLPYDQFLTRQLAADCLPQTADKSDLAALGFLTVGRRFVNNLPDVIDDRIDVLMRGTQALTVTCARCHDHKFDPIPTKDYYSLYGIFAGSTEQTVPLVDKPERTTAFLAYEKELKARQDAFDKALEGKRAEVSDRLRRQIERYLPAVLDVETLPSPDFYIILSPEDLNPAVVRRWKSYLVAASKTYHPIFAPWYTFEKLTEAEFRVKAVDLARQFARNDAPSRRLNPSVARLFAGNPPASMREVTTLYSKLFAEIDSKWRALVEKAGKEKTPPPTALPDPDEEALRQILYAADSPATVPALRIGEIEIYFDEGTRNELNKLQKKIDELYLESPATPLHAQVLSELPAQRPARVFVRGNPRALGDEAPRRYLAAVCGPDRKAFTQGSGRLELARAIANRSNPLTARVMVNRIWMHHFGAGLVHTPSDFGSRSEPPTNPELLDWLAAWFMDNGWSIKKLHRLIVMSSVYRQSSEDRPAVRARDSENSLLWRMNRQRLDLEAMRDSLLAAAGAIDMKMGGPSVDITAEPFSGRRTVYGFIDRQNLPGMFRVFDFANPDTHSPQRFVTTVPQQALFLMNSPFVAFTARKLAEHVKTDGGDKEKIRLLYRQVFQRDPTAHEVDRGIAFIQHAQAMSTTVALAAASVDAAKAPKTLTPWERYAQALLLTNEFMFVD